MRPSSLHEMLERDPSRPVQMGRYLVLRCIGVGGMGIVYEAKDLAGREHVALKTLRRMSPSGLFRFKNEFRSARDLNHPNMVKVRDLASIGGEWFLTMEYVDGQSFVDYVRPHRDGTTLGQTIDVVFPATATATASCLPADAPPEDAAGLLEVRRGPLHEGRLRFALAQLAAAVGALHDAGRLHRDLNPSNVLVTREDRLVLIDFGLITCAPCGRVDASSFDGLSGTPGYMAPEQAAAKPATAASDWYSVGVMLFVALTGQLPFFGKENQILVAKQERDAPHPRDLAKDAPADLAALTAELLRRRPQDRPSGPEVLRRLGAAPPRPPEIGARRSTGPIVGRDEPLALLRAAFEAALDGEPVVALVQGGPGAGKTALVERFVDGLPDDAIDLRARCHEREAIPYRAFDPIVDALAHLLRRLPSREASALLPADTGALAQLFPVLGTMSALAPEIAAAPSPGEIPRRAAAALGVLLRRIAATRPLVIVLDDAQWADAGSAAMLAAIVAPEDRPEARGAEPSSGVFPVEGAGLLFVVVQRAEPGAPCALLDEVRLREGAVRAVPVGPLDDASCRALAIGRLGRDDAEAQALAAAIAVEATHNPHLVDLLARHAGTTRAASASLADAVEACLAGLPMETRKLAATVAVARRPVEIPVALAAAGAGAASFALLRAAHLVRPSGAGDHAECYHEHVRAILAAAIPEAEQRAIHAELARVLGAHPHGSADALAEHLRGAGDLAAASDHFERAAAEAAREGACVRAAALYREALACAPGGGPREGRIRVALADALAAAGRTEEAARLHRAALDDAGASRPPLEALDLQRRAAEALLLSGRVDEGMSLLGPVLDAVGAGYDERQSRTLTALFARLADLRLVAPSEDAEPRDVSPEDRLRIAALWSAGKGLALADPSRAVGPTCHALLLALAAGDARQVTLGLAAAGCLSTLTGGKTDVERGSRFLDRASQRAFRAGDARLDAFAWSCAGLARLYAGRFRVALHHAEEALRLLGDREDAAWERTICRSTALHALAALGDLLERDRRAAAWLGEARAAGDPLAEVEAALAAAAGHLAAGDPITARRTAEAAIGRWSIDGFLLQHLDALALEIGCDLYEDRPLDAWKRICRAWPSLEGSPLFRVQRVRVRAHHLRARAALGAAQAHPGGADRLLLAAEADAAALEREGRPLARGAAALLRAGVAWTRGDPSRCLAHLTRAAVRHEGAEMRLHAACARRLEGALLGGSGGRSLAARATAAIAAQGVRDPARWAAMMTGIEG